MTLPLPYPIAASVLLKQTDHKLTYIHIRSVYSLCCVSSHPYHREYMLLLFEPKCVIEGIKRERITERWYGILVQEVIARFVAKHPYA